MNDAKMKPRMKLAIDTKVAQKKAELGISVEGSLPSLIGTLQGRYVDRVLELLYLVCMPRQSRIDAPGALHHIIARGIEKRRIFEPASSWTCTGSKNSESLPMLWS